MHHPTDPAGSDDAVTARTLRRIELFEQAGDDWRFAESLKSITEDTAQEYEGRAVLELVQNGHDALHAQEPGRVLVRLDLRSAAGVLYVANEGAGFTERNFHAITEFALSDKGAGEGIGNKGIGFRSVLQLTDWPEIYSKHGPSSSTFDGYCFRFATPADVRALVDDGRAEEVIAKVSPLALPVPADVTDPVLKELAFEGFSTVVRLPLRNPAAADAAQSQLERITAGEAPLLLFLDRITELAVEVHSDEEPSTRRCLTRSARQSELVSARPEDWAVEIDLAEAGRYLLARRAVPAEAFREAIERSVQAHQIDGRWNTWEGEAWVGLALRLDEDLQHGRMYTYLPMAETSRSPFCGHVHAPFFTKLARLDISQTIALNDFLLDQVADLAAALSERLRTEAPHERARELVLDLVCWKPKDRIDRAFAGRLADQPVVPLVGTSWDSLRNSYTWPEEERAWRVITSERLSRVGGPMLDPRVTGARRGRLKQLHRDLLGTLMDTPQAAAAGWVQAIAEELADDRVDATAGTWTDFYDDLAHAFIHRSDTLRGKRIILDQNGGLQPALGAAPQHGGPERTVFFSPPAAGKEAGKDKNTRVPSDLKALRRRMAFTHPGIAWSRAGRHFLEQHQLVHTFDIDQVLTDLRGLLAATESDALRRDALVFVHRQFPVLSETQRTRLREVGLLVPRVDGSWAKATECLFSPAWGTEGATRFARFLAAGGADVPALAEQRDQWIAAPAAWPEEVHALDGYGEFLRAIGVQDGLLLTPVARRIDARNGRELQPRGLAARFGLGTALGDAWAADVRQAGWAEGAHPWTSYRFNTLPVHLPGAAEVTGLKPAARQEFAALLLLGLRSWSKSDFSTTVYRPRPTNQDVHVWPTPLASALRHLPWLPVQDPEGDGLRFVAPGQAWFSEDRDLPAFVPSISPDIRKLLADRAVVPRLRRAGLRIWDEQGFAAPAVKDLGSALALNHVPDHLSVAFKKQYGRVLALAAKQRRWPWAAGEPVQLAVETGPVLTPLTPSTVEVHVADETAPLKESLIELVEQPLLVTAAGSGTEVATFLEANGVPVARLSATHVELQRPDGELITAQDAAELLVDGREWLVTVVGLALELKSGARHRHSEQRVHALLDEFRTIRLVREDEVAVVVAGTKAKPPQTTRSLPLSDLGHPTIVVWDCRDAWEEITSCASAISQLLRQPSLHDALELALVKLKQHVGDEPPAELDDLALALAFGTTEARIAELRRSLTGEVLVAVRRLRPVLVCLAGGDRTREIEEVLGRATSEEALVEALDRYQDVLPLAAAELLGLARSHPNPADLRDALHLEFQQFNAALVALGPPYAPLRHPEAHTEAFEAFVQGNAAAIRDRLRERYAPSAARGEDVPEYVAARRLDDLAPDPAWLTRFASPPEHALRARVADWLRSHGADDDLDRSCGLDPVDGLRSDNFARLDRMVEELAPLVAAWCLRHATAQPPAWNSTPGLEANRGLERSGLCDLVRLGREQLLQVVGSSLGLPTGMPLSTDLSTLGLSPADVSRATTKRTRSAGGGSVTRPTITVGHTELRVGIDQYAAIAELAGRSVDEAFLSQSGKVTLGAMTRQEQRGSRGAVGGRTVVARMAGATEEERAAIGLVGEVTARAWLERRYPEVYWRSGYAAVLHDDQDAADGHGYDFEVRRGPRTIFYEVKSLTQPASELTEFELGVSEIRAANRYAAANRYRILLVTSVLEPSERRIHDLPNPFSAKARDRFRIVGQGLRYRCSPLNGPGRR
ncbi:sacsin N-terminal ATP-binding-like domain-containing protein [Kitasatospora sp. NPDC127121]|uniref:sacsin N-terminal ATP-binding-like domain-containing protein n=1 Tax=unclassified Kitasatospora TaxID=2633591 RepID=UPI003625E853